jgi:hypothetical protein
METRITREGVIGKRGTILRLAKTGQLARIRAMLAQLRSLGTAATAGIIG